MKTFDLNIMIIYLSEKNLANLIFMLIFYDVKIQCIIGIYPLLVFDEKEITNYIVSTTILSKL